MPLPLWQRQCKCETPKKPKSYSKRIETFTFDCKRLQTFKGSLCKGFVSVIFDQKNRIFSSKCFGTLFPSRILQSYQAWLSLSLATMKLFTLITGRPVDPFVPYFEAHYPVLIFVAILVSVVFGIVKTKGSMEDSEWVTHFCFWANNARILKFDFSMCTIWRSIEKLL